MRFLIAFALLILSLPTLANERPEFGIDFNIPSAIEGYKKQLKFISGTLSVAKPNSRYEVALPFFFHDHTFDPTVCCVVDIKRVDLQLRAYTNVKREGFYFGLIARHSAVSGVDYFNQTTPVSYQRLGAGVVLGMKKHFIGGIYYGANINIGKFLSEGEVLAHGSDGISFFGPSDNGESRFYNIELLKFGIRF